MWVQIQALLAIEKAEVVVVVEVLWSNTRSNIKVTKPQMFNRKAGKISDFLIAYKLYIRMRMRDMVL